jgi:hypothetical protein
MNKKKHYAAYLKGTANSRYTIRTRIMENVMNCDARGSELRGIWG